MKAVRILPLLCLLFSVTLLSVWGAGIFPSSLCIVAAVMSAGAALAAHLAIRRRGCERAVVTPPAWAFGVFLAAVVLSAVPVPGRLDGMFGGLRYGQDNLVRETLSEAEVLGLTDPGIVSFSLSRNRAGTWRICLLMVVMLCSGLIGAGLSSGQKKFLVQFIVVLLAVMAVAGYLHQWVWPRHKTLWWIWNVPHGHPVGCFVNRTHHAGLIALGVPLALSVLGYSLRDGRVIQGIIAGLACMVMSFAVLVSMARGALVAMVAACCVVLLILAARRPSRRVVISCAAALAVMAGSWVVITRLPAGPLKQQVMERIATLKDPARTDSAKRRFGVWRDCIDIWQHYPLAGVGGNAFRTVFPQHRTSMDREFFTHTENEYMGLLVEGGVIGMALAVLVAAAIFVAWRENIGRGAVAEIVSTGAAGSLVAALTHNLVDFPIRAPLYAIVISAIVGMMLSRGEGDRYRATFQMHRRVAVSCLMLPSLVVLVFLALNRGPGPLEYDSHIVIPSAESSTLTRMLIYSPTSWQTWYSMGTSLRRPDNPEANRLAGKCVTRAAVYDPNNYLLWESVGYFRFGLGDEEGAKEAFARMNELRAWKEPPDMDIRGY